MSILKTPNNSPFSDESDADRRRGLLADDALSLDMVSAFAGDRKLTEAESAHLSEIRNTRGLRFYCDILYSITHQYFPPEKAENLWNKVLQHKYHLSEILKRNVRIVVATLDYLSNITANMESATLVDEANIEKIVELSLRDGLTGLFNHTYFYQQIDFEVKRYVRYGAHVSLILIDIDDFKVVNDTYGHREGDRILAEMGKKLLHIQRDSDVCCRYGGEEFSVILPLTNIHEACSIAGRLRVELAERLPDGRTVTVSIGVASCGTMTGTYRQLVERADEALYQVKRSGKNRVQVVANREADPE
jgi:diguanylate cyclase (GGDEF)-like protein